MKTTILASAITILPTVQSAVAQVCMEPDELHAALVDWYAESPDGPLSDVGDSVTQLWTSNENDTWTLVRYYTQTSACVVAQGTDVARVMNTPQLMAELILNE